jgi:hypothetical protein
MNVAQPRVLLWVNRVVLTAHAPSPAQTSPKTRRTRRSPRFVLRTAYLRDEVHCECNLPEEAVICDYMKPGLRGRYPVQSPKSRVDINNIGNVMRIPCSTAVLRVVSLVPGTNADTCEEPLSAARVKAGVWRSNNYVGDYAAVRQTHGRFR